VPANPPSVVIVKDAITVQVGSSKLCVKFYQDSGDVLIGMG
jgi:hypothetical protein